MSITDLSMLKQIEQRLEIVRLRAEALQKFLTAIKTEEEQLLALQKIYRDNKPLYELIEDEPIPTPPPTKTIPNKLSKDKVLIGDLQNTVMLVLDAYDELTTGEIYKYVVELRPQTRYDTAAACVSKLYKKGYLQKTASRTYKKIKEKVL